jgi:cell division protease FtsH
MIDEAYQMAKEMLSADIENLKAGAKLLLERETITPADFAPLQRQPKLPDAGISPRLAVRGI